MNFKLRDWLFSRQRYWGEPFPILWKDGRHEAIAESELPLLAPELEDYKPSGSPEPILSKATAWVDLGNGVTRETNTMPSGPVRAGITCAIATPGTPIVS